MRRCLDMMPWQPLVIQELSWVSCSEPGRVTAERPSRFRPQTRHSLPPCLRFSCACSLQRLWQSRFTACSSFRLHSLAPRHGPPTRRHAAPGGPPSERCSLAERCLRAETRHAQASGPACPTCHAALRPRCCSHNLACIPCTPSQKSYSQKSYSQNSCSLDPMTPPSWLPRLKLARASDFAAVDQLFDEQADSPCTPMGAGIPSAVPNAPPPPKLLGL